jgi:uncharacterized protein (TIGR02266 family)
MLFEGKKQVCRTRNISLGGVYVETPLPLAIGTTIQLRFQLPTQPEPVEVSGDVRWVVTKKAAGEEVGMGIRFQGLRARDVWALNRFFQTTA